MITKMRARAFVGDKVRAHKFWISPCGEVFVWVPDPIAGYFTRRHSLSDRTIKRIRAKATAEARPGI